MRLDNLRPEVQFEGASIRLKFKYPPTQEEFDTAMETINKAMEYANKVTGKDIHIIGWDQLEES